MHEIDLGDELKFKVKYKGAEYILREPTVADIQSFQSGDVDSVHGLSKFLEGLGLPEGVAPALGMSKARVLVESIVEAISKKK